MKNIYYSEEKPGQLFIIGGSVKIEVIAAEADKRGAEYIAEIVREVSAKSGIKETSEAMKEFLPANFTI